MVLVLPRVVGVSVAIRSIGSRVSSRTTDVFARAVSIASVRDGARVARTSMASRI